MGKITNAAKMIDKGYIKKKDSRVAWREQDVPGEPVMRQQRIALAANPLPEPLHKELSIA